MELFLGDKVWMHYGPNVLVVGHIIDHSPNYQLIGISPVSFDEYKKLSIAERASCPITWCERRACHYLCHTAYQDLKGHDDALSAVGKGFGFIPTGMRIIEKS